MVKRAPVESHEIVSEGSPSRTKPDAAHAPAAHEKKPRTRSRLATKGHATPALSYDLHDPNFPFGRAAVVLVPDFTEGAGGACQEMILPETVAPVIEKLMAALAERDQRISDLQGKIVALEQEASRQATASPEPSRPADPGLTYPAPPKSKMRRLTGLFRTALHGTEVRAALEALEDERARLAASSFDRHLRALAALDTIFRDTAAVIIASRQLVQTKISQDHIPPRDVFLFMLCSITSEKLKSGFTHKSPGVLSQMGQHLLELWQYGSEELVRANQITETDIVEARRTLELAISAVG